MKEEIILKKVKLKKLKIGRVILCLAVLVLIIYFIIRFVISLFTAEKDNEVTDMTDLPVSTVNDVIEEDKYPVIKEDTNSKYLGKRSRKSRRSRRIFYNFYNS